ncbi:TetR/AcrR family transcriptional regulator [Cryobacterium psychrophilum]|uniref:TetR family transcriptional regulator n=1 Tax=Cryobacterium psychrophilum TaxID=41988 RepID=A0A4Y8KNB6_9MICO|nr:TetR/AcrR family transcriptional regulator [Cryobacterium psychrophilum]TDW30250.1 TetR family transcriptional regulator [Cryobacterium psychrophilum]TFD77471.1 TetR family transcriptional regulator [Cryobacterium psychrophilum]
MPDTSPAAAHAPLTRVDVADIAVRLFRENGYEATSATQIAEAAGVSRSTFFRQFGSKDDVIFADHDELLAQISTYFTNEHEDPWVAVCEAASLVFERFRERLEIVRVRDLVVRETQVLRDRETVMVSRYEKTFAAYLRRMLPHIQPLTAIQFAAAVTATHNFELRALIRSNDRGGPEELAVKLVEVRRLFSPTFEAGGAPDARSDVVVAVFPASTSPADMARAIEEQLRSITH